MKVISNKNGPADENSGGSVPPLQLKPAAIKMFENELKGKEEGLAQYCISPPIFDFLLCSGIYAAKTRRSSERFVFFLSKPGAAFPAACSNC